MNKILLFFTFLFLNIVSLSAQQASITSSADPIMYSGATAVPVTFNIANQPAGTVYNLLVFANGNLITPVHTQAVTCGVFGCNAVSITFGTTASGAQVMSDNPNATGFTIGLSVDGVNGGVLILSAILPIELTSFDAKKTQEEVKLSWTTSEEINNDFFTLERSFDNKEFDEVSEIAGAGDSQEAISYSYTDAHVMRRATSNTAYYRLKQTDFDGQFAYSEVISVELETRQGLDITNVTANENVLDVNFTATEGQTDINVYSLNGQLVGSAQVDAIEGFNTAAVSLDKSQNGLFIVSINDGTKQVVRKFFN